MTHREMDLIFSELADLRKKLERLQWIVVLGMIASMGAPEVFNALRAILV